MRKKIPMDERVARRPVGCMITVDLYERLMEVTKEEDRPVSRTLARAIRAYVDERKESA